MNNVEESNNIASLQKKGDEASLPGQEIVYQWRHAWMRAISKAWNDEAYKSKLLNKETVMEAFIDIGFDGKEQGGNKSIDFWSLIDINIEDSSLDPDKCKPWTDEDPSQNGWYQSMDGIKPKLTLTLPPKPEAENQAMAITDYMAAGMIYPITGCC